MVTAQTSLADLFDLARLSTGNLVSGENYIVKDLFCGFEWNRIQKGNRTKLGSMYFAYAQNLQQGGNIITPLGKTPQNQQKYQKI